MFVSAGLVSGFVGRGIAMSGIAEIAVHDTDVAIAHARGLRGTLRIRARLPVECLDALSSLESVEPGSTSGPFGFVLEKHADQELHVVVHMLSCQCHAAPPSAVKILDTAARSDSPATQLSDTDVAARTATLTQRESEVMQLIVEGLSQKQIAARLGISIQTAAKHRAKVLQKMHVANDVELVRLTFHAACQPA